VPSIVEAQKIMEMLKTMIPITEKNLERLAKVCQFDGDMEAFINLAVEIFLNENEDRIQAVNQKLQEE
jgi:hypothetical protein